MFFLTLSSSDWPIQTLPLGGWRVSSWWMRRVCEETKSSSVSRNSRFGSADAKALPKWGFSSLATELWWYKKTDRPKRILNVNLKRSEAWKGLENASWVETLEQIWLLFLSLRCLCRITNRWCNCMMLPGGFVAFVHSQKRIVKLDSSKWRGWHFSAFPFNCRLQKCETPKSEDNRARSWTGSVL